MPHDGRVLFDEALKERVGSDVGDCDSSGDALGDRVNTGDSVVDSTGDAVGFAEDGC